jgi:hypothetical protein
MGGSRVLWIRLFQEKHSSAREDCAVRYDGSIGHGLNCPDEVKSREMDEIFRGNGVVSFPDSTLDLKRGSGMPLLY